MHNEEEENKRNVIKHYVNYIYQFRCKGSMLAETLKVLLGFLGSREGNFEYQRSRACKFRITVRLANRETFVSFSQFLEASA
jgi:hypothetical protein